MEQINHFERLMAQIRQENAIGVIKRFSYTEAMPVDKALELVTALGKRREPRFVIDDNNRFAYENIIKWLIGDQSMKALSSDGRSTVNGDMRKGIFLAGPPGTGKTFAMTVLREFAQLCGISFSNGYKKRPLAWEDYHASEMVDNFLAKGNCYGADDLVIPSLCVQDLGTEALESVYMGNRIQVLRKEIEMRADNGAYFTSFTSNYRMGSDYIRNAYGDRVASRLYAMCNYFEIGGNDRRR